MKKRSAEVDWRGGLELRELRGVLGVNMGRRKVPWL